MAVVGDLVPLTDGRWIIRPPTHCPHGHRRMPGRGGVVGHAPCSCGGHTTWRCGECDAVTYGPELAADCTVLDGPAAVRTL